jgi:hypothetical protein
MSTGLIDQVVRWQEVFGGGPLAAFLGLTVASAVTFLGLYIRANGQLQREQRDHLDTVKTSSALAAAVERAWSEQMRQNSAAATLQERTIAALERAVFIREGKTATLQGET